jgi:hypothetical protein
MLQALLPFFKKTNVSTKYLAELHNLSFALYMGSLSVRQSLSQSVSQWCEGEGKRVSV